MDACVIPMPSSWPWYIGWLIGSIDNNNNNNSYILGSLQGHNVVLAYPSFGVHGKTSVAGVASQLRARFKSVRFNLMVGIAGGVPETSEDVRLGDVVVGKSTAGRPGVVQFDVDGQRAEHDSIRCRASFHQPTSSSLLTAMVKAETAAIFHQSQVPRYMSEIVRKDPVTFAHPGPEQDVLFEPNHHHTTIDESEENGCHHCNPDRIRPRQPRETQDPTVHYGLIASGHRLMRHGATRDKLARKQGLLCLETEAAGLTDAAHYLLTENPSLH